MGARARGLAGADHGSIGRRIHGREWRGATHHDRTLFLRSPDVARRVIRLFRDVRPPEKADYDLTPHEIRLLKLMVDGHSYKSAATILQVTGDEAEKWIAGVEDSPGGLKTEAAGTDAKDFEYLRRIARRTGVDRSGSRCNSSRMSTGGTGRLRARPSDVRRFAPARSRG